MPPDNSHTPLAPTPTSDPDQTFCLRPIQSIHQDLPSKHRQSVSIVNPPQASCPRQRTHIDPRSRPSTSIDRSNYLRHFNYALGHIMASLNISPEELKAVEQTRQRLFQLSNSIGSLKHDVINSNPLPNLDSLQASADILQHNISSLLDIISSKDNREAFSRIVVHPSTNFPGRTQEGILYQLLRKKAEPGVEASLDEGRKTFRELCATTSANSNGGNMSATADETKVREDLVDKWLAARDYMLNDRIPTYTEKEARQPFSEEEVEMGIENVRTGLRQKLEMVDSDDEGDDDDDDDDDDEDAGGANKDVEMLDRPPQPAGMAAGQSAGLTLGGMFKSVSASRALRQGQLQAQQGQAMR
ncbi:mediator of RNA polymerase II transcription subunit 8 [Apiospora arundinis]